MSLRLTLRTLLAYLDDTLEPAQAKAIGLKVAESEAAQELVERIKQVTRRRRLTTPPTTGPSTIDANTVAEYLDNVVTPEQAAEVEQICLSSDVHLAEVAACHQILTLILGEPIIPPAAASQRMYGLVKGPEAIPFRKPAFAKAGTEHYAESRDVDDTLRMGIPALGRKDGWRNPLLLVGGGFLAAILLVVAIFQVLNLSGRKEGDGKGNVVAQNGTNKDKSKDEKVEAGKDKQKDKEVEPADKKDGAGDKKIDTSKVVGKDKAIDGKDDVPAPVEATTGLDAPFAPPNPRSAPIGHYVPNPKDTSILLQASPDSKFAWKRLSAKQSEVYSARPLLSLPASRSEVQTNRGVRVTLWGNTPEFFYFVPIYESLVELYTSDVYDLDLLLERGRIVLTSTRKERPVRVRVRFENPLIPTDKDLMVRQEFFDIMLMNDESSILIDRWSDYPPTEPFYKNPKDPKRTGPNADLLCMVLAGTVKFRTGDMTYTMTPPPGPARMIWNSLRGPNGPHTMTAPFDYENPPLAPGFDPKVRKDVLKARDYLSAQLAKTSLDVGLYQELYSTDPSTRRLVVRSLAAISDVPNLLEVLDQPKYQDLRLTAMEALRNWTAGARDNDYKLFAALKEKYKGKEAEIIMDLMHKFSDAELRRPGLYELLIDYLVNTNLVIRELAYWHLCTIVPQGRNIPYSAAADAPTRERAEAAWRALIPPGQLPPSVTQQTKKKGA